jgi:Cu/Ag efflux pump CusA
VSRLSSLRATFPATIDVVYTARRRIAPVYVADAVIEAGLLAVLWAPGMGRRAEPHSAAPSRPAVSGT